jgi:hypothetical protein
LTPEYIDICRKLALPREWQQGDLYVVLREPDDYDLEYGPRLVCGGGLDYSDSPNAVWLPREGDWLDHLEKVGRRTVVVGHAGVDAKGHFFAESKIVVGRGRDRLTALARLYALVAAELDLDAI